jgi:hypothetical protein
MPHTASWEAIWTTPHLTSPYLIFTKGEGSVLYSQIWMWVPIVSQMNAVHTAVT